MTADCWGSVESPSAFCHIRDHPTYSELLSIVSHLSAKLQATHPNAERAQSRSALSLASSGRDGRHGRRASRAGGVGGVADPRGPWGGVDAADEFRDVPNHVADRPPAAAMARAQRAEAEGRRRTRERSHTKVREMVRIVEVPPAAERLGRETLNIRR